MSLVPFRRTRSGERRGSASRPAPTPPETRNEAIENTLNIRTAYLLRDLERLERELGRHPGLTEVAMFVGCAALALRDKAKG